MKKVILILLVMIIAAGAGFAAGVMITNSKNKPVIADLQAKVQQAEASSQANARNYNSVANALSNKLRQANMEIERLKAPAAPAEQMPPATASTDSSVPENAKLYTIQSGDSLWIIAKNQLGSGSRFEEILKLNPNISADSTLVLGSKLKIPAK